MHIVWKRDVNYDEALYCAGLYVFLTVYIKFSYKNFLVNPFLSIKVYLP